MELNEIPAAFQSRLRIGVVAALMTGEKDFTTLTKITEATPGNLGKQMELLEAEGVVSCRKERIGERTRSTYALTENGRESFRSYVLLLERMIGGAP